MTDKSQFFTWKEEKEIESHAPVRHPIYLLFSFLWSFYKSFACGEIAGKITVDLSGAIGGRMTDIVGSTHSCSNMILLILRVHKR